MNTYNAKTLESLTRIIENLKSRGIDIPFRQIRDAWNDPFMRPYLEPLDSPSPSDEHFDTFVDVYNIYTKGAASESSPSFVKQEEPSVAGVVNEPQPIQPRQPPVQQPRPAYARDAEVRTNAAPAPPPRQQQFSTPTSRQQYQAAPFARNGQSSYSTPERTLPSQSENTGRLPNDGESRRFLPSPDEVSIYTKDNEGAVCFVIAMQLKDKDRPEFGHRVMVKVIPQINNRYNPEAQKVFALTDEETLYFIKRLMNNDNTEIAFFNHGKQGEPRKHLFISTSQSGRIRLNLREKGYSRIATLDEWHRFKAINIAVRALASTLKSTPQVVFDVIKSSNITYPERVIPEKINHQQARQYEEPPFDDYPDIPPSYDSRGFE